MSKTYFDPADLKKFGEIGEFHKEYADQFFTYYNNVMKGNNLPAKTKSLIALAVAHAERCPYCIDAYTTDCVEKGISEEEMMEAVHVASAMSAGIKLVHSVQMMNKVKEITM